MEHLLLTTRQGGRRTMTAKLVAAALFVATVSLWFWLTDFFGFAAAYGTLDGGSLPVYALENFVQSVVGMTLLQYTLVSIVFKTLGAVVVGLLFLFISRFFRSTLFPYVLGLLTIFALARLYGAYASSSHLLVKICNPFTLLQCRTVFRVTEFVNFFGIPVLSYQTALLSSAVWCVLLVLALNVLTRKNTMEKGGSRRWNSLHAN